MKNAILFGWVCFMISLCHAQKIPVLHVNDKPLGLSSLDIKVSITGNIATTTYDMSFYNPTDEVLEGVLDFPLGEGFDVSRFALDIRGKLREAVVVDKEFGRVAFEAVVRRRVDPALLEKGTGNNYKARIYPIPSRGHKRVVLAYEQELQYTAGNHYYDLPLQFKNELEHFGLEITVFDQHTKPVIEKGNKKELNFSNWKRNYKTTVTKTAYTPDTPIRIAIPMRPEELKQLRNDSYIYAYTTVEPRQRLREKPKKITIFWDASLSMKERKLEKEIALLEAYFQYLNTVDVQLIQFSNVITKEERFSIKNGQWKSLRTLLENATYDGGTNYDILLTRPVTEGQVLLFTDGMYTLSDVNYRSTTPIFTINSLIKSNHNKLRQLAEQQNGTYINLNTLAAIDAIKGVQEEAYQYLGYSCSNTTAEIYPNQPQQLRTDFSIAGKGLKEGDRITLNFGYGGIISDYITVVIDDNFVQNIGTQRLWAQKKLESLNKDAKQNKKEIIQLATTHQLITDYTSLIVLDDVRDYVRYKITPPEELLEEYNRLIRDKEISDQRPRTVSDAIEPPVIREEMLDEISANSNAASRRLSSNQRRDQRLVAAPPPLNEIEELIIESDEEIVEIEEVGDIITSNSQIEAIPFSVIEIPPIYPGCENTTNRRICTSEKIGIFVKENFDIETYVNERRLSPGVHRIYTMFTVTAQGEVDDIYIRAPNEALAQEAERVLNTLPRFLPGKQSGVNVAVRYALPIVIDVPDNGQGTNHRSTTYTLGVNTSFATRSGSTNRPRPKYKGELKVRSREFITDYLKELHAIKNVDKAYEYYLIQRISHMDKPAYFMDVSNFFKNTFENETYAYRIASNIPEIDGDNYELLKAFGYHMQMESQHEIAVFIFERILELRPEDSQSYRDLALAYEAIGKCQKAFELLFSITNGNIYKNGNRRVFEGVKTIATHEIKHLIQEYSTDLELDSIPKHYKTENPLDLRIVVDWNHNDTDIDLHIIDPNLEECYYSHNTTAIGGEMSQDMTQGFGPEEFILQKAVKGDYFIKVNYYGDRYQKVENPTFMKVTIFKRYGTIEESKDVQMIRLTKRDDKAIIAKVSF